MVRVLQRGSNCGELKLKLKLKLGGMEREREMRDRTVGMKGER